MKILFISSGNNRYFRIFPFIDSQAESLRANGVKIEYFLIQGKGSWGYLRNIFKLRKYLSENKYDILHAHYALTGVVALLVLVKIPIIVSYMGSDLCGSYNVDGRRRPSSYTNIIIAQVIQFFVKGIIVKSPNLFKYIYCKKKAHIIPNGVNLNIFKAQDRIQSKKRLDLPVDKKIILFLGNPKDPQKNYRLLLKSIDSIKGAPCYLCAPYPIKPDLVPYYLSACDIIVLTSYAEGSPNVIKEAMACNCPIVATDVGGIRWLLGDLKGHYITSFEPENVAEKIKLALQFSHTFERTKARERLITLGLDAETVAKRLIEVYKDAMLK